MNPQARVAIIGIGQELRGDDAAGLSAVQALRRRLVGQDHLLLIEAGPAPENFTGLLRRFRPDRVILIDAALMGVEPGAWRRLDWKDTSNFSGSTHTLPLNILGKYLETDLGCTVELIGIQPAGNDLGAGLSPAVSSSIETIAAALIAQVNA